MDFLDYYRDNLGYLRTLGAEFAEERYLPNSKSP